MKKFVVKFLALFNAIEGAIHISGALLSFYGMYSLGVWDWRIAANPSLDIIFGVLSLLTGHHLHQMNTEDH